MTFIQVSPNRQNHPVTLGEEGSIPLPVTDEAASQFVGANQDEQKETLGPRRVGLNLEIGKK